MEIFRRGNRLTSASTAADSPRLLPAGRHSSARPYRPRLQCDLRRNYPVYILGIGRRLGALQSSLRSSALRHFV